MTGTTRLSGLTGEFILAGDEAGFRAQRLPDILRRARLTLLFMTFLNLLLAVSDWRFDGMAEFRIAMPARMLMMAAGIGGALALVRVRRFAGAQAVLLLWQLSCAGIVAVLVSLRIDMSLFAVLLVPLFYYLVMATGFRATLCAGSGSSALMLAGYAIGAGQDPDLPWVVLAMLGLNAALILVVRQSNRLQRMEWAALRAGQLADQAATHSREMIEKMFMAAPVPLVVTRFDGAIVKRNDAAIGYFGAGSRDIGRADECYADGEARAALLRALARDGGLRDYEVKTRLPDGSLRDLLLSASLITIDGEEQILSSCIDITARKAMETRLERLATTDPLTGLANRTHFFNSAEATLARSQKHGRQFGMLLLDLDHFKQLNDSMGHDAGDALLRTVGERLSSFAREGDTVARLGGDEFAMILSDVKGREHLADAATALLARLREPVAHGDHLLDCRASIGAALHPGRGYGIAELIKDADIALYAVKSDGRGAIRVFESEMRSALARRGSMLELAREALDGNRILPFYQPKIAFEGGHITGFEALLRWRHPVRGVQGPGPILAAFEDNELAIAIGDRMIEQVVADIAEWRQRGIPCGTVAINASAAEFRHGNFAERLLARLAVAGVPPAAIELEVTESVLLGRAVEQVGRALTTLSRAGIRIALDDFGTGYASLSHLKQFPVDIIKIDQSFVRDLDSDPDDAAIVRAVIMLGQSLGVTTVAEGIETSAQAAWLAGNGCDCGQGYLFSRAVQATAVPGLIAGWTAQWARQRTARAAPRAA